jgi:RNA polymerase sigma factor (sigma-70 family)
MKGRRFPLAKPMKSLLPKQAWAVATHYRRQLHQYLLRRLGRPQDVDDVAQEIYLRLLRIDDADYLRTPLAYLYRVASNVLSDWNEVEQHESHVTADSEVLERWAESPEAAWPDNPNERFELAEQIQKALARLPPLQAAILVLFEQEGFSYEEISKKLAISVHTVEKYLTLARARMRTMKWER